MIIFPSIDLRHGRVVRLIQGQYDRQIDYPVQPAQVLARFHEAGAAWVHIVDLDAARAEADSPNPQIIRELIQTSPLQVQVGGGVRDAAALQRWIDAGASRVVIGTAAFEDWAWFSSVVAEPRFAGRVVLGLDARDGVVQVAGWEASAGTQATQIAQRTRGWPLAAINFTDIRRDGTLSGPNVEAIAHMAGQTDVPIVASGGIGTMEHALSLLDLPIGGMILGRALHEGAVDLAGLIERVHARSAQRSAQSVGWRQAGGCGITEPDRG